MISASKGNTVIISAARAPNFAAERILLAAKRRCSCARADIDSPACQPPLHVLDNTLKQRALAVKRRTEPPEAATRNGGPRPDC